MDSSNKGLRITVPRPKTTSWQTFVMTPVMLNQSSPSPVGDPGEYEVILVFGIPGTEWVSGDFDIDQHIKNGRSLISLGRPGSVSKITATHKNMSAEIVTGANGTLQYARVKVHAKNMQNAYVQALDLVNPWLSYIAHLTDCGIDISCCKIVEIKTGVVLWNGMMLGRGMTIQHLIPLASTPEIMALLATYRDGLNSLNAFWQFLCFWKVTEGVYHLRKLRYNPPPGIPPATDRPDERIPRSLAAIDALGEERAPFEPYLSKKFGTVLSKLEPTHRNAVAHLNPDRNPFTIDDAATVFSVQQVTPVVRHIAHEMIQYEIDRIQPKQGAQPNASKT